MPPSFLQRRGVSDILRTIHIKKQKPMVTKRKLLATNRSSTRNSNEETSQAKKTCRVTKDDRSGEPQRYPTKKNRTVAVDGSVLEFMSRLSSQSKMWILSSCEDNNVVVVFMCMKVNN